VPLTPKRKSGKKVAVIGSGPAGLAAAQQLARAGHDVMVFERDDRIGGLLRYGIPDFKLEKGILERRLRQMRAEGVEFQPNVDVGVDISAKYLLQRFDAVVLTMGAGHPRDLDVPGRAGAKNVLFAMDYLTEQNKVVAGDVLDRMDRITAKDKVVVVIGGGDTGSDCVGTAIRQGAKEVHQFEILPKPADERPESTPWPMWPQILRTSSSHKEGCQRRWSVLTKKLSGRDDWVNELHAVEIEWEKAEDGRMHFKEKPGTEFSMKVDLVLLAMGFLHVRHVGLVENLGVERDRRGNVVTTDHMTTVPGVFAAGDTVQGASLVVTAINAGREAAAAVDAWLENQ
jgi:glutamate synthase (NADPH/NADH) small chain